jgi:hypothetical protein
MFVGGIWALATGRVPSILIGGGKQSVEGAAARGLGVLLLLPLPTVFLGGVLLVFLFGQPGVQYATWFEIGAVVGIALLAVILTRVLGKPVEFVDDIEATIAKKVQGAMMYAIMSATGVGAIVCCPLAFVYAGQALRMIDAHGVGEQYRGRVRAARVTSGVVTLLWVLGVICILSAVLAS